MNHTLPPHSCGLSPNATALSLLATSHSPANDQPHLALCSPHIQLPLALSDNRHGPGHLSLPVPAPPQAPLLRASDGRPSSPWKPPPLLDRNQPPPGPSWTSLPSCLHQSVLPARPLCTAGMLVSYEGFHVMPGHSGTQGANTAFLRSGTSAPVSLPPHPT